MWFHLSTFNHNTIGRSSLVDQIDWVSAGLLDAGHSVTMSELFAEKEAINLIWECFSVEDGLRLAASGLKYGIISTEIFDGKGFNWRTEDDWSERFKGFLNASNRAAFIWALVESSVPFYAQFAPTAFLELGYSERLVPNYVNACPTVDFSFFGQRTPYRDEAVAKLRRYATVDWPDSFMPHDEVHAMIARSKVGLNFKQSPQWPIPSGTRLGRLMLAKRGIASEFLPVPTRQGEISGLCPAGQDFVDYALSVLRDDWRKNAEIAFDRYRQTMPMKDIIDSVIAETLAGSTTTGGAAVSDTVSFVRSFRHTPETAYSDGVWNYVEYKGKYISLPISWGRFELSSKNVKYLKIFTFDELDEAKAATNALSLRFLAFLWLKARIIRNKAQAIYQRTSLFI